MKAAHQGMAAVPLPGSQGGGLFATIAQAASQASAPVVNAPANAASRPAATRASVRPEAASGLDGWLMDRLFGR
jgi:penicillin-binding protein 1A